MPFLLAPSGRPNVGRAAVLEILTANSQGGSYGRAITEIRDGFDHAKSTPLDACNDATTHSQPLIPNQAVNPAASPSTKAFEGKKGHVARQNSSSLKKCFREQNAECVPHQAARTAQGDGQRGSKERTCAIKVTLAELFPFSVMVDNVTAAKVLSKKPQTLRVWSSLQNGPIQSTKVAGRIMWSVADLQNLLDGTAAAPSH